MNCLHRLMVSHHDHLADWLSEGKPGSFQAFLDAHDPDFSLVTVPGELLDLAALRSGLSRGGGSRPGLRIRISDMTHLIPGVCQFLEQHEVDNRVVDTRVVTAVVRDGRVLGLQETARPVAED